MERGVERIDTLFGDGIDGIGKSCANSNIARGFFI
jgi:hypothetical protein